MQIKTSQIAHLLSHAVIGLDMVITEWEGRKKVGTDI